ncbi:MAG: hypothetical protein N2381_11195, partial [Armatimonadetes bacterium]|nr:hypothetical protein [Armatimonadota bacterium]
MRRLPICLLGLVMALSSNGLGQETKSLSLPTIVPKLKPQTDIVTWQKQRFGVLTTELSPAVLILCRTKTIHFFRNMEQWGLEPPTFVAVPTTKG